MTYDEKARALYTVAQFIYGRSRDLIDDSVIWSIYGIMIRRNFWDKCPGCGE